MTDKQIIIDGVDVSGCRFYDGEFEYSCQCSCTICERNQEDCYYKQLKRKEQKCEELKNELIDIKWKIEAQDIELNDNIEQLDQLKAENEELEKELRQKKATILMNNDHYFEVDKTNRKLKQTLTEIKKIAKTCNSGIDCSECPYTEECRTDTEAEALGVCKLIQQKLEVLNE